MTGRLTLSKPERLININVRQESGRPDAHMKISHYAGIALFPLFLVDAGAATIFSNLGLGDLPFVGGSSVQWEQSLGGKGDPQVTGQAVAMRFSVTGGDFELNSITLGLRQVRGVPNLRISITNDVGGNPSQSQLEISAYNPTSITSTSLALTFNSSNHPTLISGFDYWVVVEPADLNSSDASNNATYGWANNPLDETGSFRYRSPQLSGAWGPWITTSSSAITPSMKVEASAIPEPSLISVFSVFAVSCFWTRKRQPHICISKV